MMYSSAKPHDSYFSATRMWEDLNFDGNESSLNTMGVVQNQNPIFIQYYVQWQSGSGWWSFTLCRLTILKKQGITINDPPQTTSFKCPLSSIVTFHSDDAIAFGRNKSLTADTTLLHVIQLCKFGHTLEFCTTFNTINTWYVFVSETWNW